MSWVCKIVSSKTAPLVAFLLAALSGYYTYINLDSPINRDGSIFICIANNIFHGQNPYWATWETKNPLVEYYWALNYQLLLPWFSLVHATKIAEGFYLFLTSFSLYLVLARIRKELSLRSDQSGLELSLASLFIYPILLLAVLSDWRVADFGLSISLYQSLPEILFLYLCVVNLRRDSLVLSLLGGILLFTCWWTKQSSLISLTLPLCLCIYAASREGELKRYRRFLIVASIIALALVTLFIFTLYQNDTLSTYLDGALLHHFRRVDGSHLFFMERFLQTMFGFGIYGNMLFWSSLGFLIFVALSFNKRNRERDNVVIFLRAISLSWLFGSLLQAVLPLTFFRHYFLATTAPLLLSASLFIGVSKKKSARIFEYSLMFFLLAHPLNYFSQQVEQRRVLDRSAMKVNMDYLQSIIPANSTVYTWGGVCHYNMFREKPSQYPQQLWWPFIRSEVSAEWRDAKMRAILRPNPPEYILELFESTYLPGEGFTPMQLDQETLNRWTDHNYEVIVSLPERKQRYGFPIRVFKRIP